jgi:hypothetical protein
MEEQVSAVTRFADDLYAVGIAQSHIVEAICLYVDALVKPSQESWGRLYCHVSQMLKQCSGEPAEPNVARRLLAFVYDDFGGRILELPVRARLREMLLQHGMAS